MLGRVFSIDPEYDGPDNPEETPPPRGVPFMNESPLNSPPPAASPEPESNGPSRYEGIPSTVFQPLLPPPNHPPVELPPPDVLPDDPFPPINI